MKFKELREADLSKAQIKKVHDKADDLPKNDFIKRYGKEGDSVRFATATKMVKKELGIEDYEEGFKSDAQRKAAFASGYKEKGKKKDEMFSTRSLGLKGASKRSRDKAREKDKDSEKSKKKEEVEITEGRVMIAVDKKTRKKWQFSDGMIVKHNGKQYKTEGVTTQQVLELTASFGTLKLGKKDIEAGFAKGNFSVVDDGSVYQPWKNDFEPEGEKELTEAVSDAYVKQIARMTDRNDHSGARIEIAKACGDKQLVQIFSTLELIHDKYSGAVGNQSIVLRGKMMNPLNKAIERKFGKYADVIQDAR